ncbi:MarR family winged helix-turn-helix transcriptional regulator [Amycolatopsis sp. NPDC051903]|uniref:MarR family winged helix-turn-helix transcriptional regulator n=1 Tax=Amycolatopsis sp. NPDC051903 TaxID=3363936 RepID=UPI0037AC8044
MDAARRSCVLDDQLSFVLYTASRSVTSLYRPLLDQLGVTYPQYLVLLALWEYGDSSVKDLCVALHLETGTLSPLLKRLAANGLVRRVRRSDDQRSVSIALTDDGAALRARAARVPQVVGDAMGLREEELKTLRHLLTTLVGRLRHTPDCGYPTEPGTASSGGGGFHSAP